MSSEPISDAIDAIGRGEIVVVVDDSDREDEGDLIMAAEFADPERMAFFVRHTSGLISAAITADRADELDLPLMVTHNTEARSTAFTVTVDYRHGTSTGISAGDRALTARALVEPKTRSSDFARPGHLHVLRAREGGVLTRAGHTEAAVDLARLAGLRPAAVLCEVVTDDRTGMARRPELERFAKTHGLHLITVAGLIQHRMRRESLVRRTAQARLPTEWGEFTCLAYNTVFGDETHVALVMGDPRGAEDVLVRVHSECIGGDVFGSECCGCGHELRMAMQRIAQAGVGAVVYLRDHEECGIGLTHEPLTVDRSAIGEQSELGLPAGSRQHGIASQILDDLGVTTIRLVTNAPVGRVAVEGLGSESTDNPGWAPVPTGENIRYLSTTREPAPKRRDAIGGVDSLARSVSPEASGVEGSG